MKEPSILNIVKMISLRHQVTCLESNTSSSDISIQNPWVCPAYTKIEAMASSKDKTGKKASRPRRYMEYPVAYHPRSVLVEALLKYSFVRDNKNHTCPSSSSDKGDTWSMTCEACSLSMQRPARQDDGGKIQMRRHYPLARTGTNFSHRFFSAWTHNLTTTVLGKTD